jgi:hypothetical protein
MKPAASMIFSRAFMVMRITIIQRIGSCASFVVPKVFISGEVNRYKVHHWVTTRQAWHAIYDYSMARRAAT